MRTNEKRIDRVGTVIGTENGLPIDQYSTGPHIEVRYAAPGTWNASLDSWSEPWINPAPVFAAIGAQIATNSATGGLVNALANFVTGGAAGGTAPTITLAPGADVTQFLYTLDQLLTLHNPFIVQSATTDNLSIAGASISFTDPVAWVEGFGINLVENTLAMTLRMIFLVLGMFVLFKVLSTFIDFSSIISSVEGAASTAAKIGALAA